ncbi:LPXTG cell wall anchor domain-containing protein [Bifidobacterium sp. ESL0784]|uniref:DUF7507 domain-containing protein n=1 Tax=Bifidobacterium sp. ESL0784 TaxID=2983231 RepID=UPI0023F9F34A|nr:LPXTG cell wall anchor domain-containing protein [Bifidobacterium sp. ESL0784]MDF7640666.1 LPXTG cell wall anchor domain-containing protein [Bifidobacterium sp. ESL0784]
MSSTSAATTQSTSNGSETDEDAANTPSTVQSNGSTAPQASEPTVKPDMPKNDGPAATAAPLSGTTSPGQPGTNPESRKQILREGLSRNGDDTFLGEEEFKGTKPFDEKRWFAFDDACLTGGSPPTTQLQARRKISVDANGKDIGDNTTPITVVDKNDPSKTKTVNQKLLGTCHKADGTYALMGNAGRGFLQLTDENSKKYDGKTSGVGSALYDRTLPIYDGLHVSFKMYMTGTADGISFFLVKSDQTLTQSGLHGGHLGYVGIPNALLGIGFDQFGNFGAYDIPDDVAYNAHDPTKSVAGYKPVRCDPQSTNNTSRYPLVTDANARNSIERDPARGLSSFYLRGTIPHPLVGVRDSSEHGYCRLAQSDLLPSNGTRVPDKSPFLSTGIPTSSAEVGTQVDIILSPADANGRQTLDVTMVARDGTTNHVINNLPVPALPRSAKMGFSSSNGTPGAHLIRGVSANSINPLGDLNLLMQDGSEMENVPAKARYKIGDKIPYKYIVTNPGSEDMTGLSVKDGWSNSANCRATTVPVGYATECSNTHTVTAADDVDNGKVTNTATATATAAKPVSGTSSLAFPINSMGTFNVKQIINDPGGGGTLPVGQTYTVNWSYSNGTYQYCMKQEDGSFLAFPVGDGPVAQGGTEPSPTDDTVNYAGNSGSLQIDTSVAHGPQVAGGGELYLPVGATVSIVDNGAMPAVQGWHWTSSVFSPTIPVTIGCAAGHTLAVTKTNDLVKNVAVSNLPITGGNSWEWFSVIMVSAAGLLISGIVMRRRRVMKI